MSKLGRNPFEKKATTSSASMSKRTQSKRWPEQLEEVATTALAVAYLVGVRTHAQSRKLINYLLNKNSESNRKFA